MTATIHFILLSALRDRLFLSLAFAIAAIALLAAMLGNTAFIEAEAMRAGLAAGGIRAVLAVGMSLFICFHLRHMAGSRELDVLLSRPISRNQLVVTLWAGYTMAAMFLVLLAGLILALTQLPRPDALPAWLITLMAEQWILCAAAIFAGLMLRSAVASTLATLAFYVLSRLMAFFLMSAKTAPRDGINTLNHLTLELTAYLVPRLDVFAQGEWLISGPPSVMALTLPLLQGIVITALLLCLAIVDFRRRSL